MVKARKPWLVLLAIFIAPLQALARDTTFADVESGPAWTEVSPIALRDDALAPAAGALPEREGHKFDPSDLKRGRRTLNGSTFTIAEGLMLPRAPASTTQPAITDLIQVNRKTDYILALHTFSPGPAIEAWMRQVAMEKRKFNKPPPAPVVFQYVVTYDDGEQLNIPVRYGESVSDWYRTGAIAELRHATVAFMQPLHPKSGEQLVFYAMAWPNPRADKTIASLRVMSGNSQFHDYGLFAVAAVSTARRTGKGMVYYVAPSPLGDDSKPGTFDEPWATIHKAAETVQAGDTVYIRHGYYPITREIAPVHSGTADAWITYSGYFGELPVIDALGHRLEPTQQSPVRRRGPFDHDNGEIHLVDKSYLRFQGLQIAQSRRCGVYVSSGHHIDLRDLLIWRTYNSAIYAWKMTEHLRVMNCTAVEPLAKTLESDPKTGDFRMIVHPAHEGISIAGAKNFDVAFNEVYGCDKEGIDTKGPNRNGTVRHNYIHNTMAIGIYIDSHGGLMAGLDIFGNTTHDTCGIMIASEGGTPVGDVKIHHNLVYDCASNAITIGGSDTTSIQVYNNTAHNNGRGYVKMDWAAGGYLLVGNIRNITLQNNISTHNEQWQIGKSLEQPETRNIVIQNNLTYPPDKQDQSTGTVDGRRVAPTASTIAQDAMYVDPGRDDYRLQEGSPAIGAGTDGGDVGALPYGMKITPALTMSGHIRSDYGEHSAFQPVTIPTRLFNANVHHRGRGDGGWFSGPEMWDWDVRLMPAGQQWLGGVKWEIADFRDTAGHSILMLSGQGSYVDDAEIRGIPVQMKGQALWFLHTYYAGRGTEPYRRALEQASSTRSAPESPTVFYYVVHLNDGSTHRVPVQFGNDIQHWQRSDDRLGAADDPRVAWAQEFQTWRRRRDGGRGGERVQGALAAYAMRWQNPTPQAEIVSVDLVTANTATTNYGAPAVFAITVETDDSVGQP